MMERMPSEFEARKTQERRRGDREKGKKAGVGGGPDGSFPLSIIANGPRQKELRNIEERATVQTDRPLTLLPGKKATGHSMSVFPSVPSFPSFLLQCAALLPLFLPPLPPRASSIKVLCNTIQIEFRVLFLIFIFLFSAP